MYNLIYQLNNKYESQVVAVKVGAMLTASIKMKTNKNEKQMKQQMKMEKKRGSTLKIKLFYVRFHGQGHFIRHTRKRYT